MAVIGLQDKFSDLRNVNYGFSARTRHSLAVRNVELRHKSNIGYWLSKNDFSRISKFEINKGKQSIFS